MEKYTVNCPYCGVENKDLYLDDTDGVFECESCEKIVYLNTANTPGYMLPDLTTLGSRIKFCRQQRGLTKEGLSEQINVNANEIKKWENNINSPYVNELLALSDYFNVTVHWILNGIK